MTCSWAAGDAGCWRPLLRRGLMQLSACLMGQRLLGIWHAAQELRTPGAWREAGRAHWGLGCESERGRSRPDRTVLATPFECERSEEHTGNKHGTPPHLPQLTPKGIGIWPSPYLHSICPPHSILPQPDCVFPSSKPSRPPCGSEGGGSSLRSTKTSTLSSHSAPGTWGSLLVLSLGTAQPHTGPQPLLSKTG